MKSPVSHRAFTLIELLTVIAIIGLLAAIAAPTLKNFRKGDATFAATQQLLGAVAQARQLAISQRTTVYLVFVTTNFWNDPAYLNLKSMGLLTDADLHEATNLADMQLTGYNFVSLRTVGDQPGRNTPRYLSTWTALPSTVTVAQDKCIARPLYLTNLANKSGFRVYGFDMTNGIPFPLAQTAANTPAVTFPSLPIIGFDYQGRLISGQDEFIPIAQGSVTTPRDKNKIPMLVTPLTGPIEVDESPAGNMVNTYNLIHIDWLTGRARLERQQVQ
jgi:type IV fimbrial biogenesis protein FimT